MASFKPKSMKGQKPAFVWVLLDEGGSFKAVCIAAPNVKTALDPMFLAKTMQTARGAFLKSLVLGSKASTLIDPSGTPIIHDANRLPA